MHILLLSDNYPPESSAGAIRSEAHAKCWAARGHEVTVVTCFPNFPEGKLFEGYRQRLYQVEHVDGVRVVRVPTVIFPNTGTVRRALDFASFMITGTFATFFVSKPDIVVASSPQFLTAVAGWLAAAFRRKPFVFEVRDLWPDSISAVGAMRQGAILKLLGKLETFLYRRAVAVVTATDAFHRRLVRRGIDPGKIATIRNGADLATFVPGEAPELRKSLGAEGKTVVSYIGTLGMAHGLEVLIDAAEQVSAENPNVLFVLVGTGAEKEHIRGRAAGRGLRNIVFVDKVPHKDILEYWRASDITLVLLRDSHVFRDVVPSKIYEAIATGTPVISNVRGEIERVFGPSGAIYFVSPSDPEELAREISALSSCKDRRDMMRRSALALAPSFSRDQQAEKMLSILLAAGNARSQTRQP